MGLFKNDDDDDESWFDRIVIAEDFRETARKDEFDLNTEQIFNFLTSLFSRESKWILGKNAYVKTIFDEGKKLLGSDYISLTYEFGLMAKKDMFRYEDLPLLKIKLEEIGAGNYKATVEVNSALRKYINSESEFIEKLQLPEVYKNNTDLHYFKTEISDRFKDAIKEV